MNQKDKNHFIRQIWATWIYRPFYERELSYEVLSFIKIFKQIVEQKDYAKQFLLSLDYFKMLDMLWEYSNRTASM